MRVQVLSVDNGLGLSHDFRVLKNALESNAAKFPAGMTVDFTHWQDPRHVDRHHYDINIFLELYSSRFRHQAKKTVLVPNPEWFMSQWTGSVKELDAVWCKTLHGEKLFRPLTNRVTYVGWTSDDKYDATCPRKKKMVHLFGGSSAKGTKSLIAAMRLVPDITLAIVGREKLNNLPPNVTQTTERLDDGLFNTMQNMALIHACPSSYEGFGHYMNEARSVGAVIVTTNAAPMNEMVTAKFGFGVGANAGLQQNLAQHWDADVESLAQAIRAAHALSEEKLIAIGQRARQAYLQERDMFHDRLCKAVLALT